MSNPERAINHTPNIRVLIADDSSFMRNALTHILKAEASIEVIDTAIDGEEALIKIRQQRPDVVLLDIKMPRLDGLTALKQIMAEIPTNVIILSGMELEDSSIVMKSIQYGAIDFISKPSGTISYDIDDIAEEIVSKIRMVALANKFSHRQPELDAMSKSAGKNKLVVIGASTGGPRAVQIVLSGLPQQEAAFLVVQHMDEDFTSAFVEQLNLTCQIPVFIAHDEDVIVPGHILVAPGNHNISIITKNSKKIIRHAPDSPPHQSCSSIDMAMKSAAEQYGSDTIGVLLTGMGNDGARGMDTIRKSGGHTIAEHKSTCLIYSIPKAAIELGCVDEVLPLPMIAYAISKSINMTQAF